MKKGLSLILAIAMVFSMFASVAFAAEKDAGTYLQELKVIKGDANGDLMANADWNRQDVAVLLSRLLGVEATAKATAKAHTYADVTDSFYDGYLSWAKANKYMEGNSATDFGYNKPITNQQFAAVVLRALGVDTTGDNYAKTMELAVKAGIIDAGAKADANAKRGETYTVIVKALSVEVPGAGKTLGAVLGLPGFDQVKLAATAKQTGAKELTVTFNTKAADDVTVAVKSGFLTVDGAVKFADDRKSAVFTATEALAAGDYVISVKGLEDITVKAEAAKLATLQITNTAVQAIANNDVTFKAVDQFGGAFKVDSGLTFTAYNITDGADLTEGALDVDNQKFTITSTLVKDKEVLLNIVHNTGISAQKTLKVVAASAVASVTLGTPAPFVVDAKRVEVSTDVVVPVKIVDQYGTEKTIDSDDDLAGVTFISSNTSVIGNTYEVKKNSKDVWVVTFKAGATAGTATLTAVVPATAAQSSTSVTVNALPALNAVTVTQPTGLVVADEKVTVKLAGKDQYGADKKVAALSDLYWISTDKTVVDPDHNLAINADGNLEVTPVKEGSVTLTAFLKGAAQGSITLNAKAEAVVAKINGLSSTAVTKFVYNEGVYTYGVSDFVIVDQYNRVINDDHPSLDVTDAGLTIEEKTTADNVVALAGRVATGSTVLGESVLKATYASKSFEFKVNTINARDVVNYEVTVPTITLLKQYATPSFSDTTVKVQQFVLKNGLDKDNNKVAVAPGLELYSNNSNVVIDSAKTGKVAGVGAKDSTAVVTVFKAGKQVAQTTFTVSTDAEAAATVAFTADVKKSFDSTTAANYDFKTELEVKDQYGYDFTKNGTFYVTDSSVLNVSSAGIANIATGFTGEAEVTVSYVTANAKIASVVVKVKK